MLDLNTPIKIDGTVLDVPGTTASLKENDTLTYNELMYGMMLPSGNDAAFMLAFKLGQVLIEYIAPVDESL